jgi:putative chitinase
MHLTEANIRKLAPRAADWIIDGLVAHQDLIEQHGVNTPRRFQHFMAQIAHESDGFKTTREYASGAAYEGRKDLGNTQPGDGRRYRGRGLIQLTGRDNVTRASEHFDRPYVEQPELLEKFPDALLAALWFWNWRNINAPADRDDVVRVTRLINGGTNGLKDRKTYLERAKRIWPDGDRQETGTVARATAKVSDVRVDKHWLTKGRMREIQTQLYKLGYTEVGTIDGALGPRSRSAIKIYWDERGIPAKARVVDAAFLARLNASSPRKIPDSRRKMTMNELQKRGSDTIPTGKTGMAATAGGAIKTVQENADTVSSTVNQVRDPIDWLWGLMGSALLWVLALAAFVGAAYLIWRMMKNRLRDEQLGKTITNPVKIERARELDPDDDEPVVAESDDELIVDDEDEEDELERA